MWCSNSVTSTTTTTIPGQTTTTTIPRPDLVINRIWKEGSTIWYEIENQGDLGVDDDSCSFLYVDDNPNVVHYNYVFPLEAQSSKEKAFTDYTWTCSGNEDTIKVCADEPRWITESNEDNNCKQETFTC